MNLAVYSVFIRKNRQRVELKIIYAAHSRKTNWKIGDKIIAGEKENTFWNSYRNYSPVVKVNEQKMPLFEMFTRLPSRHKCIWLTDNENLA